MLIKYKINLLLIDIEISLNQIEVSVIELIQVIAFDHRLQKDDDHIFYDYQKTLNICKKKSLTDST